MLSCDVSGLVTITQFTDTCSLARSNLVPDLCALRNFLPGIKNFLPVTNVQDSMSGMQIRTGAHGAYVSSATEEFPYGIQRLAAAHINTDWSVDHERVGAEQRALGSGRDRV
jgi:hypothetical protein